MTPARNLASDTKLQGLHGGKAAGGHVARDGGPKANGDAFSALLGQAGGTAKNQPADAARASGQADAHVADAIGDANEALLPDHLPTNPSSAGAALGADEPSSDRERPMRDPGAAEKGDTSLDALLAAFGAPGGAKSGGTTADDEVAADDGEQAVSRAPESSAPESRAADVPRGAPLILPTEADRTFDPPLPASLVSSKPKLAKAADVGIGGEAPVRLDPDQFRIRAVATAGAAKSAGSKVDFVSLRTDFEPSELRRADTDVTGDAVPGRAVHAKASTAASAVTLKAVSERMATFDADKSGTSEVGDKRKSDIVLSKGADGSKPGVVDAGKPAARDLAAGGNAVGAIPHSAAERERKVAGDGHPDPDMRIATPQTEGMHDNSSRLPPSRQLHSSFERIDRADRASAVARPNSGMDETAALTRQVASAVGAQISAVIPSASAPAGATAAVSTPSAAPSENVRLRAGGAALKTLQIQLQPENLGTLDVTMKLVGGQLAIHLAASEASTALALKDDADGLRKLLTKAGFDIDEAAITISTRDGAASRVGNAAGQASTSANAGQGGGGQASASGQGFGSAGQGPANGDPQSRRQETPFAETAKGADPAHAPPSDLSGRETRRGGSVYL